MFNLVFLFSPPGMLLCKNLIQQDSCFARILQGSLARSDKQSPQDWHYPLTAIGKNGSRCHIYAYVYMHYISLYTLHLYTGKELLVVLRPFFQRQFGDLHNGCARFGESTQAVIFASAGCWLRPLQDRNTHTTHLTPVQPQHIYSILVYSTIIYFYLTSTHMSKEPFSPDGLIVPVKPLYHGCIFFIGFLSAWICKGEN